MRISAPSVKTILSVTAALSEISVDEILSPNRSNYLCQLRSLIISLAREYLKDLNETEHSLLGNKYSFPNLAKSLGRSDHTTSMNLYKNFGKYCQKNPELAKLKANVRDICNGERVDIEEIIKNKKLKNQVRKDIERQERKILYEQQRREAEAKKILNAEEREKYLKQTLQLRYQRKINFNNRSQFFPKQLDEVDGSHLHLLDIAKGSEKLLQAIKKTNQMHW